MGRLQLLLFGVAIAWFGKVTPTQAVIVLAESNLAQVDDVAIAVGTSPLTPVSSSTYMSDPLNFTISVTMIANGGQVAIPAPRFVAVVPELTFWITLTLGFCLVGFARRRSTKRPA